MGQRDGRPSEPILHVDMDAFYAAVEVRDDPRLRGRPVVVGGPGGRGVVASASYEARAFGIASAMPMREARRRCDHLVVVEPRFGVYRDVSEALQRIFGSVTPLVEPLALDEAFLDVGGSARLLGSPVDIAAALRSRIADELELTASVGIAANKFLAKLCSRSAKPDGLLHLPRDQTERFLATLPVGELWGVGERTAARLAGVGIRSVRELRTVDERGLAGLVGAAAARSLQALAHGLDERTVRAAVAAKGLSAEQTFPSDLERTREVHNALLELCDRVARRLRRSGLRARTVTVKVRDASFTTRTRSRTLAIATCESAELHPVVVELLATGWSPPTPVRLLGVAASRLVPVDAGVQLDIFSTSRWEHAERVVDRVREQYGDRALTRGVLLDRDGPTNRAPSRDDLPGGFG